MIQKYGYIRPLLPSISKQNPIFIFTTTTTQGKLGTEWQDFSERFWSMEAVRNCLWKSCWKTVTGDYHENQDESTQMTMKAERLEKWTPGLELEKQQRKVTASEWGWSRQEDEHVRKVVAQRIREPAEPAWGLPGAWEVGRDSMLGHSMETMVDSKLETSLELNVIQFLFYLDWTFLILQVRFASVALLCVRDALEQRPRKGAAILGMWSEEGKNVSRSLVGIYLQKKPEFEERLTILVWTLCLLPELSPSCQTSGPILGRVPPFSCMIFNNNMPFSQGHHFICLIHFGMLVFAALVNTMRGWSLNVSKACKTENLDLFGSRVLLLKGILCFALKFAFFFKYGRAGQSTFNEKE